MRRPGRRLVALVLWLGLVAAPLRAEDEVDPDREVIQRFAELWAERVGRYEKNQWLGFQTLQNPMDAWVTQEVIQSVKPDFIVETGTYKGGSALYWAMVLEQANPEGRVITIDVKDRSAAARKRPLWAERIEFLHGSSTDPEIVAEVKRRVGDGRVLVILDSLHTRGHVLAELQAYAPLVGVGSYVIVQDTGLAEPSEEPTWASQGVRAFLESNGDFVVDSRRERFMITNNPGGYLRRAR